ncbi:hypothetical protein MHPYR_530003 [uncultured Mycobacterium sp.]|uniref:Uncharacterized protein n=1 Tax=uncultured Mycobacterium sp. TaxID=171292 RepID=A0A1Y5PHL7_9MYCO|nr:hypothetical protein MHPYR_530003 [uncultured Mycobacterium sp.]
MLLFSRGTTANRAHQAVKLRGVNLEQSRADAYRVDAASGDPAANRPVVDAKPFGGFGERDQLGVSGTGGACFGHGFSSE